jgi:hypothetical protein
MSATAMNDELLRQVQADQRTAGELVREGATVEQLEQLRSQSRAALGVEVPHAVLEFLRESNGLDYNGLVIYDCTSSPQSPSGGFWQGLVAANLAWRENPSLRSVLVLGDSDMDLYAWRADTGAWLRMDRIAHDRVQTYGSFESMIEEALQARL